MSSIVLTQFFLSYFFFNLFFWGGSLRIFILGLFCFVFCSARDGISGFSWITCPTSELCPGPFSKFRITFTK